SPIGAPRSGRGSAPVIPRPRGRNADPDHSPEIPGRIPGGLVIGVPFGENLLDRGVERLPRAVAACAEFGHQDRLVVAPAGVRALEVVWREGTPRLEFRGEMGERLLLQLIRSVLRVPDPGGRPLELEPAPET